MATIAQKWIEHGTKRTAHEALLDILTIRCATVPPALAQALSQVNDTARLRKEALTTALWRNLSSC